MHIHLAGQIAKSVLFWPLEKILSEVGGGRFFSARFSCLFSDLPWNELPKFVFFVLAATAVMIAVGRRTLAQDAPSANAAADVSGTSDDNWAPAPLKGFEWISDLRTAQAKTVETKRDAAAPDQPAAADSKPADTKSSDAKNNTNKGFDSAVVSQGQTAFNSDCTQCHDAERSTGKSKSLAEWKATVARMAGKDGANIPAGDRDAIATYLASLSSSASGGSGGGGDASAAAAGVSITATISPWWRGGGSSNLQRPGFFPETWVGGAWQGSGPISGRVTACITCHNEAISRVELVEAAVRFDLTKCIGCCCDECDDRQVQASVEAGRFVGPLRRVLSGSEPRRVSHRHETVDLQHGMSEFFPINWAFPCCRCRMPTKGPPPM